ncbi:ATP-binding protein [Mariprofundus sp. EBB-1]|uniref:AlbA family DNA-binding domain-containing protein n=1 Tax=Mariprofundus sp. EBB-1 TaxID=2650971 RepID=UPI000EF1DDA4|nr:ATP-binding protein [Mariprofundus sp. EBB-1]RLL51761.1 ATP-binding protein [Mariprofundus sp. EBB-1]
MSQRRIQWYHSRFRMIFAHIFIGSMFGVIILHPITKVIYWLEIKESLTGDASNLQSFLLNQFQQSLSYDQWLINFIFATIGIGISMIFTYYNQKILNQSRQIQLMEQMLSTDTPSLISSGESEFLEFKSSVRWDIRRDCINKDLEPIITKSIAGFMNHKGGTLILGVADSGDIVGLENDFNTIKHKNRDGFERLIMDLIEVSLGRDCCALVHCTFQTIEAKEICRISIDASKIPVYVKKGHFAQYFVRTGNGTRELDAREAHAHILQH